MKLATLRSLHQMADDTWGERVKAATPQLRARFGTKLRESVSGRSLTSLRAGGPAALLLEPADLADLTAAVDLSVRCELPLLPIGRGSNVVLRDGGVQALVVQYRRALTGVSMADNLVIAESGVDMPQLATATARAGISGLEFLCGIPGLVGGGVYMNAGCHGSDFAAHVVWVEALQPDGSIERRPAEDLEWHWRTSTFQKRDELILRVALDVTPGSSGRSVAMVQSIMDERRAKMPLGQPNCGSVFKSPTTRPAWQFIDAAGLRGLRIGDAQVSEKHPNFIVNLGSAAGDDIAALIPRVQEEVRRHTGASLEPEVLVIGSPAGGSCN